jgi:hypothetical protein
VCVFPGGAQRALDVRRRVLPARASTALGKTARAQARAEHARVRRVKAPRNAGAAALVREGLSGAVASLKVRYTCMRQIS